MSITSRHYRRKLTTYQWQWFCSLLTEYNHGQFWIQNDRDFRGVIWTADRSHRAVVERMDVGFVWKITNADTKQCVATGGGDKWLVIENLLDHLERAQRQEVISKARRREVNAERGLTDSSDGSLVATEGV